MQSRILILFNFLLVVPLISADESVKCRELDGDFNICEKNNALVVVNETIPCVYGCQHHLDINELNVTSIAPNAFKNMPIRHLGMSFQGNSVALKPESFEGLPKVVDLVISSAILSLGENMFKALRSVTHLHLMNCRIVELKKGAFAALPKLRLLRLSTNISTIDRDTFYGVKEDISTLGLANNKISVLKPNSFEGVKGLLHLDLSNNQLTELEPGVFNGLSELNDLWVRQNQLTTIPKNVFNNLRSIDHLDLSGNKIIVIEAGAFNGPYIHCLNLQYNQLTDNSSESFNGVEMWELQLIGNDNITDTDIFKKGTIGRIDVDYE